MHVSFLGPPCLIPWPAAVPATSLGGRPFIRQTMPLLLLVLLTLQIAAAHGLRVDRAHVGREGGSGFTRYRAARSGSDGEREKVREGGGRHAVSFKRDTVTLRLEASKEASLMNCLVNVVILTICLLYKCPL